MSVIVSLTFGFLLLFSRSINAKADRFLAYLMFIVALWNLSILILDLNIYRYAAGVIWLPLQYSLALGPCFYFYTYYITHTHEIPRHNIWPHFMPVIVQIGLFLAETFVGLGVGIPYFETSLFITFNPLIECIGILSLLIYGFLGRDQVQRYQSWVNNNFSQSHLYNLNWLLRLGSVFLYVWVLWLCYFLIDFALFDYHLSFNDYYPFHLVLAVIAIWISVEAFFKPEIVFPERTIQPPLAADANNKTNTDIQTKAVWLERQIADNLLYLDPELSLKSLAETLEIHPNLISRLINEGLKMTFSECINGYRVKAVIGKLHNKDLQKSKLLAIAFECGFNSKSTFNRVFKKITGQTPAQFQSNSIK